MDRRQFALTAASFALAPAAFAAEPPMITPQPAGSHKPIPELPIDPPGLMQVGDPRGQRKDDELIRQLVQIAPRKTTTASATPSAIRSRASFSGVSSRA
jgi:hypothetical protein